MDAGEAPLVEVGRLGGENFSGTRRGVLGSDCFRGAIGNGAAERGRSARVVGSNFFVAERRGGGTLGFVFSSSSCCSLADLKDAGDDGP